MKASEEVKLEMDHLRQQPCLSTVKNLCNVNAQLKIAYINAQSLHRHKMDVEHDFNLSNADMLFCSETRFQESDAKLLTEMSGMHSFWNDAVKRGTQRPPYGIAVYYKPNLIRQLPTIANMNGVEILVCPIKRGCDNSIKVMAVYKPPAVPLQCLLNSLYSAVRNHCGDGQLIIMGDFNVDIYGSSSDYKQLKQFMSDMGLKQHIEEMTTDMRTAIDHIYSNVESMICGVSETYYSFHKSIWVALMWIIKGSTLSPMGSEDCIMDGITVNCQGWYSTSPVGSEECITEGITVNCQGWYSMGPMGSEECITEGMTVNCQGWYSMGPMGSEECITEGITVNCHGWYSMGPVGSEKCITEGITVNCQGWYSTSPVGSEECITEGITLNC